MYLVIVHVATLNEDGSAGGVFKSDEYFIEEIEDWDTEILEKCKAGSMAVYTSKNIATAYAFIHSVTKLD